MTLACGGGGAPPPAPVVTATPVPTATPIPDPVIAAAGDIACGPVRSGSQCRDADTARLLVEAPLFMNQDVEAVLPLGDLQYEHGLLEDFLNYYHRTWGRAKEISWPTPGNHEYAASPATGYFDYWNGRGAANGRAGPRELGYYSFDIGAWHLISLNSNCGHVGCEAGSRQERWLRDDLVRHRRLCTLAYWHHPRFSSGPSRNDDRLQPLWQALYDGGADVVLSGHDHLYERFAPQTATGVLDDGRGIRQFTVGTGGRDLYPFGAIQPNSEARFRDEFGVLYLKLQPHGYGWRFATIDNRPSFVDSGVALCH